jgi:hypothetical protein
MHSQVETAADLQEYFRHREFGSSWRSSASLRVAQQVGKETVGVRRIFLTGLNHLHQRLEIHRQDHNRWWSPCLPWHDTQSAWPYAAGVETPMQKMEWLTPITRQKYSRFKIYELTSNITQAKDARRKESWLQRSGRHLRVACRPLSAF